LQPTTFELVINLKNSARTRHQDSQFDSAARGKGDQMNRRRKLLKLFGVCTLALPLPAFAQQPAKVPRIGLLISETLAGQASRIEALRAGLRGPWLYRKQKHRNRTSPGRQRLRAPAALAA
jgi:hypothetical protein